MIMNIKEQTKYKWSIKMNSMLNKKNIILLIAILFIPLSCEKKIYKTEIILDPAEQNWLALHKNVIYFAPDPFYAPFEFLDEQDGRTKGLAHDYIKLIERNLGVEFIKMQASSFEEILTLAKAKEVSIVNAATKTPERSEYLLFTEPIVEIKNVIIVPKGYDTGLSLEELNGKRVSLVQGYAITEFIQKNHPNIKCDLVSTDLNAILNVSYRISDAAIIDLATASYLTDKEGISNIQVAGDAGYPVRLAIGSRKDWPELNSILSKGLSSVTSEERDEIYRKWIHLSGVGFYRSREFQILVVFIILLFAVSGMILLWNKQLKKQILLRTSKLKNALDDLTAVEMELRESEIHFRTLADSGQALIWTAGVDKKCNYFNKTWLNFTGRTLEQEIGDGWTEGVHPEDIKQCVKIYTESADRRESFSMEYRLRNSAGEYRWLQDDGTPRFNSRNEFIGYIGYCLDITERKLADEKVKNLLAEKELLLQEVHHRIKNNMNTIKGLLTLQISAEENPSVVESLTDAERRVQSMIMLYDRLYCTDNYRELSVKDYLLPLTEEIVGSFPNRKMVKIKTDIEDFILNIQILTPLGIIINELLTNTMKHAFAGRDDGVITVSVERKDGHVKIKIMDDGVGMARSTGTGKIKGFGLDLVKLLTEQIGGHLKNESVNGTAFVLEFDV